MLYSYKERCFEAIFQVHGLEKVLSLIIDGMDQAKNDIPKEGTQGHFENPIRQHLVGCKVHGHGVSFYSTFGTISGKSPDFIIHIISNEIAKFKARNDGVFPEKIYVQVDGGGENANKYVLGFLELLVAKRIAKLVLFTRLPVGHTHEDIDA